MCPNCGAATLYPVKTLEQTKIETAQQLDKQRYHPSDQDRFNARDVTSQMGHPLTTAQLVDVLRKLVGGIVPIPSWNGFLGRRLMGLYVRDSRSDLARMLTHDFRTDRLRFVCACEYSVMPEWDVLPTDDKGLPQPQVRGWRSVVAIFYRAGLLDALPLDDTVRRSWYELRESRFSDKRF